MEISVLERLCSILVLSLREKVQKLIIFRSLWLPKDSTKMSEQKLSTSGKTLAQPSFPNPFLSKGESIPIEDW